MAKKPQKPKLPQGGWMSCETAIHAATGGVFNDDQMEAILDQLSERAKAVQQRAAGALSQEEAFRTAATELGEAEKMAAAIAQRNARINAELRVGRRQRMLAHAKVLKDPQDAIHAEIRSINTPLRGGRFSAEAEGKALANLYGGGLVTELEQGGLFRAARSGALEADWTRELFELSKGEDGGGEPGVTGNETARRIAEIVHKYQTLAKVNLNKAGAWIGDYQGYVARTAHDSDRIRKAGYPAWRDAMFDLLDPRTFDDAPDREAFLSRTYQALITGVHMTAGSAEGMGEPAFTGPGNLAKRLSSERVLHFRDSEAWRTYQKRFGEPTILQSVMNGLNRSARDTAIMRRWGTNPEAEFKADLRWLQEQLRDSDPDRTVKLGSKRRALETEFAYLTGEADRPQNRLGARVGSYIRLDESMAKLGGVAFTHLGAGFTKAAELRYHGIGLLTSYGDFLQSFLRGRGTGETREIMDLIGAGLEGMQREVLGRFQPDDSLPGTASKLANLYFKMNGLTYLLNAQKGGASFVLARHLGGLLEHDHDALPEATRRALNTYDIGPEDWAALKAASGARTIAGRKFLTPDLAHRAGLSDDAAEALSIRLHSYFHDTADRAIVTPGIAEKALLLQGAPPGTALGEALRFIAQFKQWPTAVIRQQVGRELNGGQSRPAAIAGLLHMALGSVVFGYLRMVLRDLSKGMTPRDPTDPKTMAAAMMQGGGVGILGDYLFGEYNRFGQSPAEALLGPVLGSSAAAVVDLWNRLKAKALDPEHKHDLAPEAMRLALDHTPFINLFYARAALNYLWLYQVQEALSPGYLRRYERRIKQENHQDFWLKPTGSVR
jgi:hypothetical protein